MREQYVTSNMLISMDSIGGEEWFYFIRFTIVCKNCDCVIEFGTKLLPFVESGICIDLFDLILLHVVENDKITILIGASITSN